MKKIFNLALVAMLALGAASCTKDDATNGGGVTPNGDNLTFTISGALASGITYATTVAPEVGESRIDEFDVLQFDWTTDGTGVFVNRYTVPVSELVTDGTKKKAIISGVTKSVADAGYKYYVVVNGTSLANLVKDTKLTGKTENEVLNYLADAIGTTDPIEIPLLITGASTASAGTTGIVPVTAKRSVARFDILKKADASQKTMDISKVIIRDAFQESAIFYNAPVAALTPRTLKMNFEVEDDANLDGTGLLTYVAQGSNGDKIAKSVFYLNPTTVSTLGTTTSISIEASFDGGTPKLYHINGPVTISPNYRYTLIANPENLTIELLIADWDDDDEEHYFEANGNFTPQSFSAGIAANWDAINRLYTPDGNEDIITMVFKASSTAGVTVTPEVVIAGGPAITVESIQTDNTITYAAPGYNSTVKVKVAAGDVSSAFLTRLKITDAANPSTSYEIVISKVPGTIIGEDGEEVVMYEPVGLPAVKIGDLWWAPVNVGADSENSFGYLFQWGNNNPIPVSAGNTVSVYSNTISYTEYLSGLASGQYITPAGTSPDWLNEGDSNFADRNSAWVNNTNTPCPAGWNIPSREQLQKLVDRRSYTSSWTVETNGIRMREDNLGTNYSLFTFNPSVGTAGVPTDVTIYYVWGSDYSYSAPNHLGVCVVLSSGSFQLRDRSIGMALAVRCVKDVTVTP